MVDFDAIVFGLCLATALWVIGLAVVSITFARASRVGKVKEIHQNTMEGFGYASVAVGVGVIVGASIVKSA